MELDECEVNLVVFSDDGALLLGQYIFPSSVLALTRHTWGPSWLRFYGMTRWQLTKDEWRNCVVEKTFCHDQSEYVFAMCNIIVRGVEQAL